MSKSSSQIRLYVILARKAHFGVVFRRGPSKSVLLIGWNTSNDTFEQGQWLKGRIYERRCDLSPDGSLLLYFAANYRKPLYSWSAISRPPFLTALLLWPKGDGWGGGGHFLSQRRIALNHRDNEMQIANGFSIPKWLSIEPFGKRPGWGEDDPIWSERLRRDGWSLTSYPKATKDDFGAKVGWEPSPPIGWRKPNPQWPKKYALEMSIVGMIERNGPWYMTEHSVVRNGTILDKLGRTDWADWGHSGDLLFAMDGCLYRVRCAQGVLEQLEDAKKIADFSNLKFEQREAPRKALRWK